MADILVSIIIPTRSRKDLLLRALRSALAQTYAHLQVVVQDNNSKDGSREYIAAHVQDSRLEYYRSDMDLTMQGNWNAAFSHVRGEYFLRLDDDNVLAADFIEKAIVSIKAQRLDVVVYQPLIIQLQDDYYTLFDATANLFLLSRNDSFWYEWMCLTDSNYALYRTQLVRDVMGGNTIYVTTLPDRYTNMLLAREIDRRGLRIGFSGRVMGMTRYDYRSRIPAGYELVWVDYTKVTPQTINSMLDCQTNFYMHRVNTVQQFLEHVQDTSVNTWFNEHILSPSLYKTLMEIGHLYMARECYSWKEFRIYCAYWKKIYVSLLLHPTDMIDGKKAWFMFLTFTYHALQSFGRSIVNIATGKKRVPDEVTPGLGDKIADALIAHTPLSFIEPIPSQGHTLLGRVLPSSNS